MVYESVSLDKLDAIAAENDFTVVAAGRAELCKVFPRDAARSVYAAPQRKLCLVITRGGRMGFDGVPFLPVKFNLFLPYGEAFWAPYHHKDHGPTWNMLFEGKPGGPFDRFDGVKSGEEALAIAKRIIRGAHPVGLRVGEGHGARRSPRVARRDRDADRARARGQAPFGARGHARSATRRSRSIR